MTLVDILLGFSVVVVVVVVDFDGDDDEGREELLHWDLLAIETY